MSRKDEIQQLIIAHQRHLHVLEMQQAQYGLDTPPRILLEIEDIKAKIAELETESAQEEIPTLPPLSVSRISHNLPPRSEFIAREREKAQVHNALRSRSCLVSIDGIGGIGKSSLALEVVYECLNASRGEAPSSDIPLFSGFIWTTAKDRDLTLDIFLDTIARMLEYPGIAQQPVHEKLSAVQRLLQQKSYLLIVDNFETVTDEGIRDFLIELPEPSKALITTREQKLSQARTISLKGLTEPEALALIRSEGERLGLSAVQKAGDQILLRLYQATGGAPLAIRWAVAQIKQKGQSLDLVLDSLHNAKGDIFVEIFGRSWTLLSAETQRVLMVMPLFAASASRDAIEAASDIHHFGLDEALGQIVEMWLLEATDELEASKRRFSVHPLTRSFANSHLIENLEFLNQARSRLAAYYIEHCLEMGQWAYTAGFPWFETELPNIFGVVEWANSVQQWNTITSIFRGLWYFLGTRGYWQERIKYGWMALEAARQADDPESEALCQHALAYIFHGQGKYKEAQELLEACTQFYIKTGQKDSLVSSMITLAQAEISMGDLERAQATVDQGISLAQDAGLEPVPDGLLAVQGVIELETGNLDKARHWLLAALEASKKKGDTPSTSTRQIDLGYIALAQNQLEQAETYFQVGLESSRHFLRQDNIARANLGLAKVHARRNDTDRAREIALDVRERFIRMGMKREIKQVDEFLQQLSSVEEK